ncbi:hypothetical protein HMI55_006960 [Coelomomyces lativittatus]|nr:hypothetical protein HMI55_006960 [Coelomomyces lativittatus]
MSLTYTPFLKQETTTPLTKINTHELQCLTKKDIDSPSLTTPPHHLQDPTHSQFTSSSFLFPTKRSLATSIHEPHGIHKTNSSSSSTTTTTTTNQPLEVTNDRLTKGNEMENKNKNEDNEDEDNEEEEEEELMLSINKKFSHLQLMEGATLSFNLSQAHAGSLESLESRRRSLNNSYGNHTRNATYLPGLVMNEPSYFYSLHDTIDIQHLLPNHQTALLNALDSNVLDHQFRAVTQLRRFLSLDKISKAIDLVLDLNRLPTLIGLLKLNNPSLQYELCWIFTNICAGTHHQTMHLVHHGFIPDLLDLLGRLPTFTMTSCPSNLDVHIQTYWCLGNLCGDSALLRHQLIQHGLIQVMVQHPSSSGSSTSSHETSSSLAFLQKHPWNPQYEAWVHFHRIFCWVMANLCRGTKTLEEWSWVGYHT